MLYLLSVLPSVVPFRFPPAFFLPSYDEKRLFTDLFRVYNADSQSSNCCLMEFLALPLLLSLLLLMASG